MNFQLKLINNITEYNSLLYSADDYTFLQSWPFGEMKIQDGHNVKRYKLITNNKNLLVLQVLQIKAKRGNIMQLRHAPVLLSSLEELSNDELVEMWDYLFTELKQLAKANNLDFIRIQPKITLDDPKLASLQQKLSENNFVSSSAHNIDAEKTLVLDLQPDEDKLMENMRKQTRYYIRRAKRDGIKIEVTKDISKIKTFFDIHHDTTVRQDFKSYSLEYYEQFFSAMNNSQDENLQADLFLAYTPKDYKLADGKSVGGTPFSAAIVIYMGKRAFYSDGGSLTEFSKLPGSYLIQWEAIKRAKELGCLTYDFWGGVSPEHKSEKYPWAGIDLFKRGFGGDRVEHLHAQDLGTSIKFPLIRLWEYYEKKRRGY